MMIESHKKAAAFLIEIKNKAAEKLKNRISERNLAKFILSEYKKRKIKSSGKPKVIVAFGKNTSEIHHFPKNDRLAEGPVILDLWAKQKNGCFADLTWTLYKGNPSKSFESAFKTAVEARNKALSFLKKCLKKKYLPTMVEIDSIARSYLAEKRLGYAFMHRVGHMLWKKVHADNKKGYYERLRLNVPYALEPGIYFKGKFGIRIENDFWIDEHFKLHLTEIQNKLLLVS